jgi:hypothetical protein
MSIETAAPKPIAPAEPSPDATASSSLMTRVAIGAAIGSAAIAAAVIYAGTSGKRADRRRS